ncbi:mitotic-spindle organizing protein 1-like [Dysidea avara]|uniref:mitotic-spindle organizing protein 1-like n=1 Tax=Dysidea avara TaxID=196820 RepID=UPI003329066B
MSGKPAAKKAAQDGQLSETREAMKTVREISRLLKTGLDDNSLRICVQLCEAGVNPEALATVIQELRREAAALKEDDRPSGR